MNGLDLFSGIGGISLALKPWVRTIAYCEQDRYAQAILLSRMRHGLLDRAPIWPDVRTLKGSMLPEIDIIFGGFPCQDISTAGAGKGLAGERSGLFFEIVRLIDELRPKFVFLENVPAIRTRGSEAVGKELAKRGYDCRWDVVSAQDVGAPHIRKRWWLAAYAHDRRELQSAQGGDEPGIGAGDLCEYVAHTPGVRCGQVSERESIQGGEPRASDELSQVRAEEDLADTCCERLKEHGRWTSCEHAEVTGDRNDHWGRDWWEAEPAVGRVADGIPHRVDRIRCLGNSICPQAGREAFKRLMGLK